MAGFPAFSACVRSLGVVAVLAMAGPAQAADASAPAILQWFDSSYQTQEKRVADFFRAGYGSTWIPPTGRADSGNQSVGYDVFDRFDLGDTPQRGHWETRYGSRTSLRNLVDNAHQSDINIYPDIVFNHTGNGPDFRT